MKIVILIVAALLFSACAKEQPAPPQPSAAPTAQPEAAKNDTNNAAKPVEHEAATGHDTTKSTDLSTVVKAAFPEAESIKMRHKDLNASHVAQTEKIYGVKLVESDFHTYVAYGTQNGKRAQLGAATVVDVAGTEGPVQLVVVYSNDIVIKKVIPVKGSGDLVAPAFLDQFAGKNHDEKFEFGKEIKYQGKNTTGAQAITEAIKKDILSLQALYGKAHAH